MRLHPDDFEVERTENLTASSTVLMLDLSLSMPMRDNFLAAKKVAMALHSLISSQFPRDYLGIVGFCEVARELKPEQLPEVSWDFVYGTNMQHGFLLSRRLLARQTGTKQIIMITDGEPTAHIEPDGQVFFNYPPVPETVDATLREVARCTRDGIRINTFMLDANSYLKAFVEKLTQMNRGRAFFTTPETLGDYVLVDFIEQKRGPARRRAAAPDASASRRLRCASAGLLLADARQSVQALPGGALRRRNASASSRWPFCRCIPPCAITMGTRDNAHRCNYIGCHPNRPACADRSRGRRLADEQGRPAGPCTIRIEPDDRSWQDEANCLGVDPDLFFPERGASTREAKEVCRGCVVREDCLEYALANGEKFGIWGGMSERERRRIRRQRAQAARRPAVGLSDRPGLAGGPSRASIVRSASRQSSSAQRAGGIASSTASGTRPTSSAPATGAGRPPRRRPAAGPTSSGRPGSC